MTRKYTRSWLGGLLLALALGSGPALAATATLLPNGEQQFFNNNGESLALGSVCMYVPNTLTAKQTWQDAGETTPNTSPCVTLDGGGRAIIYGSGQYRQRVLDVSGNVIWDQLSQDLFALVNSSGVFNGGTSSGTANAQIVTVSSGFPTALAAGQLFDFKAGLTNTGPMTLNINGLGAKNVLMPGQNGASPAPAGALGSGSEALVVYDGTAFQLVSAQAQQAPGVLNVAWWGVDLTGATDATTILTAMDAVASGKTVTCPPGSTVAVKGLTLSHLAAIDGCSFVLASGATTSDHMIVYTGSGPFTVSNSNFSCPFYDPKTGAEPAGSFALQVEPFPASSEQIKILHTKFAGCDTVQFRAIGVQDLYIDDMDNDRPFGFGWIVNSSIDSLTAGTGHIFIRNTRGHAPGSYCGSIPANLPASGVVLTPRVIDVQEVFCENAGLKDNKLCYDLTGSNMDQVVFRGWGTNCWNGGIEVKKSAENGSAVPNVDANFDVEFTYYSNTDIGYGITVPHEAPGTTPSERKQAYVKGFVTYESPPAWQASTNYDSGSVVTNGGNTYWLITPGVSAGSGGPVFGSGCDDDGTTQWCFIQTTPVTTAAAVLGACYMEDINDLRFDCTGYNVNSGFSVAPRGSSNNQINRVDLHFQGTVAGECFRDINAGFVDTITRMRLLNWECRSTGTAAPIAFYFGNTWVDFQIEGGSFSSSSSTTAAIRNSGGIISSMNIFGAPRFEAPFGWLYATGSTSTNVKWSGGGIINLTSTSALNAILGDSTSSGTVLVDTPVSLDTAVGITTSGYGAWQATGSSTLVVKGDFMRGWLGTSPSGARSCSIGDMFRTTAPTGGAVLGWFCSTANTSGTGTFTAL